MVRAGLDRHGERRSVRGVRQNVLDECIDHSLSIDARNGNRSRRIRDFCRDGAVLIRRKRSPEIDAVPRSGSQIGPRLFLPSNGAPCLPDDEIGGALEFIQVGLQSLLLRATVESVNAEASCRQRCSQAMSEVGGGLSFCLEQSSYLRSESIELQADVFHFWRSRRFHAGVEVTVAQLVRGGGQLVDWNDHRPAKAICNPRCDCDQRNTECGQDEPASPHSLLELCGRHEHPDHGGGAVGCEHRDVGGNSALDLGDERGP